MPDEPKDLKRLKRDVLDEVAADAGVPNPDELPNKDAVVKAIEAPNPALAPVPEADEEPRERAYKVTGVQPVFDHDPGSEFTGRIPAEQERLLLGSGHITRIQTED